MRRSIVVGVDGSDGAIEAALVAVSLAHNLDRRLVLAHVAADQPRPPYGAYVDRGPREARRKQLLAGGGELLEAVAYEIGEPTADQRVVLGRLGSGYVEDRLAMLTREEDADLLVVGSRRRHPLVRALISGPAGSPTASLASMSACPIVAVPHGTSRGFEDQTSFGSIVCGVDGSLGSDRALVVAADLANRMGLRMLPISTGRSHRLGEDGNILEVPGRDPAATLAEAASRNQAQLIVVGMRSPEERRRSVSRTLASEAPSPVLIVPPRIRLPQFKSARVVEPALAA